MRHESEVRLARMLHGYRLHGICKKQRDGYQGANYHGSSPEDDGGPGSCLQILLHDSLLVRTPCPSTTCSTSLTVPRSYYYYFYTYIYAIELTTITSTYTTTTTTVSVYAANSRSAAAQLSSLSSSVEENDFTTPARATTALNSTPAGPTASSSSSSNEPFQDDSTDDSDEDASPTLPGVGGPGLGTSPVPGAGVQAGIVPVWAMAWALGAGLVAWGMVWL